jgi:hypothetical protein
MTTGAARLSAGRGVSGWRLVAYLVLLAFTLQSYVTQSHIHDGLRGFGALAMVKGDAKAPPHRKSPLDDNPLNCSICQAVAHAGAFLVPAALSFLPALSAELAPPFIAMRSVGARAMHNWQSRAPPQH